MKYLFSLLFALLLAVAPATAMNNADVVKMVKAGLSDDVIVAAIRGTADADFSTEAMDLIALKDSGVSDAVLQAMINPSAGAPASSGSAAPEKDTLSPEVVTVTFDGQSENMRYLVPTMRTAARGFGFGGVATYMVMRGTEAQLQMDDRQPVFLVSIPGNAQPEGYVDLASFAVRKNGSREVLVGGGYMSYSTGIHPDRRMPFTLTKLEDQSKATDGFVLYEVQPSQPLESGQYALVFYNAEIAVPGFFGTGSNSCFDFTVR